MLPFIEGALFPPLMPMMLLDYAEGSSFRAAAADYFALRHTRHPGFSFSMLPFRWLVR